MYFTDEKDYIMRMIKEMVRILFSLIYGKRWMIFLLPVNSNDFFTLR